MLQSLYTPNSHPKRFENISNHIKNAETCRLQLQDLVEKIEEEPIDVSKKDLIQTFNTIIDKINKKDCEGALEETYSFLHRNCFEK